MSEIVSDFIMLSKLEDESLIDDLIKCNQKYRKRGVVGTKQAIDLDVKNSWDTILVNNPNENEEISKAADKYYNFIMEKLSDYVEFFNILENTMSPLEIIQPGNIQYYPSGGGFFPFHAENTSGAQDIASRVLVYMTYLNDVEEGGETEFLYQQIKFKPIRGNTIIWPAGFTHAHRGIPSDTSEKVIVTGWINYGPT
jgi:prolyl 4-hydroxylase